MSSSTEEDKIKRHEFEDSSAEELTEDEEITKEDLEFINEETAAADGAETEDSESELDASNSDSDTPSERDLSDDDLELIEENLGKRRGGVEKTSSKGKSVPGGKFKRLRSRRNEIESSSESDGQEEEEEGKNGNRKSLKGNKNLANLFDDSDAADSETGDISGNESESGDNSSMDDFIEDDEENFSDELPENIDAAMKQKSKANKLTKGIPSRRAIVDDREAPKRALSAAFESGQISKHAWEEMMEIFGDGSEYADLVVSEDESEGEGEDRGQGKEEERPQDLFHPQIDKMRPTEDSYQEINAANFDIPERFLDLKIVDTSSAQIDEALLQRESNYIAKKLEKLKSTDSFPGLCSAIASVLRFIHVHGLEVPFIATYRKEYFLQFFGMNEIWTILDEDVVFKKLIEIKRKINNLLENNRVQDQESTDDDFDKEDSLMMEEEWDESQLLFIQEFLIRKQQKNPSAASNIQKQKISSVSVAKAERQAKLLQLAQKVLSSPGRFLENIVKRRVVNGCAIFSEKVLETEVVDLMARDFSGNSTYESVISGAIQIASDEFGAHPGLFAQIRDLMLYQATITITPTSLGSIEINHDPTHYLAALQYITRKPISAFIEDQGLLVSRGLEAKLIEIKIEYSENEANLLEQVKQFLPGLETFKVNVFDRIWSEFWRPRLNRLILQKLRSDAEIWTAHFAQFYLQDELMTAPLKVSGLSDTDVALTSICAWPSSPVYLVEFDKFGRVLRHESIIPVNLNRPEKSILPRLASRHVSIVVGGEGRECLNLFQGLKETRLSKTVNWGHDDTAIIYRTSLRAAREFPESAAELKYAVSIGRRALNPVSEFAFMTDAEILQLNLHSMQSSVPESLLLKHLRRALINVINLLGVPINELQLPGQKLAFLRHVSGFGVQSAGNLIKKIGNRTLQSRAELVTQYGLGRKVFTNCAGFIKISAHEQRASDRRKKGGKVVEVGSEMMIEPLDGTRIHPESYDLARKMAADALELDDPSVIQRRQDIFGSDDDEGNGNGNRNENPSTSSLNSRSILLIMKDPKKLDDLLLEEYAREIERLRHLPKHVTLFDIKAELQGPFPDPRSRNGDHGLVEVAPQQVLKMLTGKEENWWWIGRAVQVKLLQPVTKKLCNLVDCKGFLAGVDDASIPRNVRPGAVITAYLNRVDVSRLLIDVVLERGKMNLKELAMKSIDFDPFYDFNRAKTGEIANTEKAPSSNPTTATAIAVILDNKASNLNTKTPGGSSISTAPSGRQLNHPAFKNVSREESEKFLYSAPLGEFLLRPSSQKRVGGDLPGDLTLTWKAGPGLFAHVPLGEMDRSRGQDWLLGRVLLLPALIRPAPDSPTVDRFEDLDEIVARRIEPIISLLQEAQGCPKYFANFALDAVLNHLKEQMALNPERKAYCVSMAPAPHCGHLLLSHLAGSRHELVRVDPRGYSLTNPRTGEQKIFERIEKLVDYFKKHYSDFSVAGVKKGEKGVDVGQKSQSLVDQEREKDKDRDTRSVDHRDHREYNDHRGTSSSTTTTSYGSSSRDPRDRPRDSRDSRQNDPRHSKYQQFAN